MKSLLLGIVFATAFAGAANALPGVLVKGKWERKNDGTVALYKMNNGRLEEQCSYKLSKDGNFGFYFQPEQEGFFVIGTGNAGALQDKYSVYLKSGDELNLLVNDSAYQLAGKNSAENKELYKWYQAMYRVERKSVYFNKTRSTYVDFFPELEAAAAKAATYKAGKTGNKKFDTDFMFYRKLAMNSIAMAFITTPRSAHPKTTDLSAFYRNMNVAELSGTADVYRFPHGLRTLSYMLRMQSRIKGIDRPDIAERLNYISNDTLKGELVLEEADMLKTYLGWQSLEKLYGKYILTEDQQARAKAVVAKFANEAKSGTAALNFTYPDLDGKKVSLSDFKGKVVLVDVWATWCGPCKVEIPALKKMELEMRDKDIVFLSVSVDEAKDHQKWKDFVAKEELKGVQLFASGWSEIAQYYNIKGIPRFMVFDKKGNIVTIDAPRPSSPELKPLLESELKK